MTAVEVMLLGPIELSDGLSSFRPPGMKLRTTVAMLALTPGKVVSADELMNELWVESPPSKARNALQAHIGRLRKILSGRLGEAAAREILQTHPSGYSLQVSSDAVDVDRFIATVARARGARATNLERSADLLRGALGMWRGPALLDVGEGPQCRIAAVRLDELRLQAEEEQLDVKIALGLHDSAVLELEQLVARYPLRERLCEQLMLALYHSGRQTDALQVYQRIRQRLQADLGLEPGPSLRSRLREILNHDPVLVRSR